ncbi:MAG: hypothetical protein J6N21_09450 [Butyrivibrio sp.]|nr:hypothetical protein [Butyrivibrio sp.]
MKKKILEIFFIMLFMSLIVFGTTILFGTLTSGWHFVDDEEFFKYQYWMQYKNMSLWDVIKAQLAIDRTTRNNSLYYPTRILTFYIFGANSFALSVVKAVQTVIAMVLLYFCGKKISDSVGISILFSLTCYVGYQSAVWWKLGPPHVEATICFGLAFLFLLKWLENTKKKAFMLISFIFMIMMGYYHESFFMLIPFMGAYVIYDAYKKNEFTGIRFKTNSIIVSIREIFEILGKRSIYAIAAFLAFILIMLSIVLRLGLNSYDAVGVDASTSIISYIKMIILSLDYDIKWYWKFGVALVCVLLTFYEKLKRYIPEILVAGLIVAPQFVLYGKEGISERYILPAVIGYALFFVVFMLREPIMSGMRKKIYIILLIVLLFVNAHAMVVEADYYRFRGQSVTKALEQIDEMSAKGYNVMSCLGNANPEAEMVVEYYLLSQGRDNIFYWNQDKSVVSDERAFGNPNSKEVIPLSQVDVVVAYNRNDRHFEVDPNFDLSDFVLIRAGSIDIYYKNDALSEVTDELRDRLYVKPTLYGIGE